MRASAVLFLTLYLLHALVAELDGALAGLHVWIFAGGLYVTYAALVFPLREALPATLMAGLACDASAPIPFGTHATLFALAHIGVFELRERLQRDETAVRVVMALVLNLAMFAALAAVEARTSPPSGQPWGRMASDLFWSELAVGLAAPWFFALQAASLKLCRAQPSRVI